MGRNSLIALIDGDVVAYQCASKAQQSYEWEDGIITQSADANEVRRHVDGLVRDIKHEVKAKHAVLAFTDETSNFRKDVFPPYKSNRRDKPKPIALFTAREYIAKAYGTLRRPHLEADDCMGIAATGGFERLPAEDLVICSIDKDMFTFPGRVYNWRKPEEGIITTTEEEADCNFFEQILVGDQSDFYPGCPGLGKVRAARLMSPFYREVIGQEDVVDVFDKISAWQAIVAAYEHAGLTEQDAITQARCARILRACDYNTATREITLWTPPLQSSMTPK